MCASSCIFPPKFWRGQNCPLGHFFKGQCQLQCGIGAMARPGSNPEQRSFSLSLTSNSPQSSKDYWSDLNHDNVHISFRQLLLISSDHKCPVFFALSLTHKINVFSQRKDSRQCKKTSKKSITITLQMKRKINLYTWIYSRNM